MNLNKKKIFRAVTVSMSCVFFDEIMRKMRDKGYEMVALTSPGQELDALKEDGFLCVEVPMERHISPIKDFKALIKLIRVFRKEKPYVVHSMTPKAGLLCMMAAWLTRVPVRIHTFTGLVWPTASGLKRKILMATDRLTCACATHIIPEGEGVKQDLLSGHITKKSLRVLGYGNVRGVDMEHFSKTPEVMEKAAALKDNTKFTFLFVGRIVRDKGINELVSAFKEVSKTYPEARLLLVGRFENDLDPIAPETQQEINKNSKIIAVGPQYGINLLAHYAASDCFAFPSYREGFPNTVLEAGAMGLPCIVTDINGSREIIREGINGSIVPSKDVKALEAAMIDIIENHEKRKSMSNYARRHIMERYEKGYVQQCLLDFYDEILN